MAPLPKSVNPRRVALERQRPDAVKRSPTALAEHELVAVDKWPRGMRGAQGHRIVPRVTLAPVAWLAGDILTDSELVVRGRMVDEIAAAVAGLRTEETI